MVNPATEEIKRLRAYFYHEYDIHTPREINFGYCTEFAEELEHILKEKGIDVEYLHSDWFSVIHSLPVHAWVKVGGRHYDAETPEGVTDWRNLEIFKRDARRVGSRYYFGPNRFTKY